MTSRQIFQGMLAAALTLAANAPVYPAAIRKAPLPDGLAPSGEPAVRGLYAQSVYSLIEVTESLTQLATACRQRGKTLKVEGRDLLRKGTRRLYRSADRVALFRDDPAIESDAQACTATITLVRRSMVTPARPEDLQAAGWLEVRPTCPNRAKGCKKTQIAGLAAMCGERGEGPSGTTICFSVQEDLSKDLILEQSVPATDPRLPGIGWGLEVVMTDALIDPVVFRSEF